MKKYLPDADIIVVEQVDDKPFNRGKLLNVGLTFTLMTERHTYIFHDVDKIPVNVDYSYASKPTQLEKSSIQRESYFGGVTIFNDHDLLKINGFSNNFWGWGGEDNELYNNVIKHKLEIEYRDCTFKSLPHKINGTFSMSKWKQAHLPRKEDDGFSNCSFTFLSNEQMDGYMLIKVEL